MASRRPANDDRSKRQRATAADVAKEAGLSAAAVSLVINGRAQGRVSQAKQEIVWKTVERLGYSVDPVGRSLSTGRGSIVGLVAPDVINPFYSNVAMGAAEALGKRYQLVLIVSELGQAVKAQDLTEILAWRPAGLLVASPGASLAQQLAGWSGDLVLLDAPGVRSSAPTINLDVRGGARQLADHLADLGHREIAYLDGIPASRTFAARRQVLIARLRQRGMRLPRERIARCGHQLQAAGEAFMEAWPGWQEAGVTAVVCATDTRAYAVMHSAHRLGIAIPEELALAGFDDLSYSSVMRPALTSVDLPGYELGRAAAELLRQMAEAPDQPVRAATMLGGTLRVRESTAQRR